MAANHPVFPNMFTLCPKNLHLRLSRATCPNESRRARLVGAEEASAASTFAKLRFETAIISRAYHHSLSATGYPSSYSMCKKSKITAIWAVAQNHHRRSKSCIPYIYLQRKTQLLGLRLVTDHQQQVRIQTEELAGRLGFPGLTLYN